MGRHQLTSRDLKSVLIKKKISPLALCSKRCLNVEVTENGLGFNPEAVIQQQPHSKEKGKDPRWDRKLMLGRNDGTRRPGCHNS